MLLAKKQRNDLFDVLVSAQLDPAEWSLTARERSVKLRHKTTKSYLEISTSASRRVVMYFSTVFAHKSGMNSLKLKRLAIG